MVHEFDNNVEKLVQGLRKNFRVKHPTDLELLVRSIQDNDYEPVLKSILAEVTTTPSSDVRFALAEINSKLKQFGLEVYRESAYGIRKISD
jgi:hypothetical protein